MVYPDPEATPARQGRNKQPWPELPPLAALTAGVPLGVVLHQGVRNALQRSLAHGFTARVRAALQTEGLLPVCWYGQQGASWVAYYDVLRRLGLARYASQDLRGFDDWAAVVRACGWWWPDEETCVVVERPERVRTEPVPNSWHGEVQVGRDGVRYRDGWQPHLS
ncbi:MAG TPA: hypothetical protein VH561_01835 [Micromonosporaceae bacterium]